jgi:hypothetical protein
MPKRQTAPHLENIFRDELERENARGENHAI